MMEFNLNDTPDIIAFTDGGCHPNPGFGGWGWLLLHKSGKSAASRGGEQDSTNNRMEFMAAINLLSRLKRRTSIEIRTDSQLLVNTMTKWAHGWEKKGWKKSSGEEPKNLDLVKQLHELQGKHDISWVWVRGHNGRPGNEFVDQLATRARQALTKGNDPTWSMTYTEHPVAFDNPW